MITPLFIFTVFMLTLGPHASLPKGQWQEEAGKKLNG